MTRCPSTALLRQLLADEVSGPDAETLEAHVETCAGCQQALDQLTGAAGWSVPAGASGAGPDFLRRLEQAPPRRPAPPQSWRAIRKG